MAAAEGQESTLEPAPRQVFAASIVPEREPQKLGLPYRATDVIDARHLPQVLDGSRGTRDRNVFVAGRVPRPQ
jgi:hypothetical protein